MCVCVCPFQLAVGGVIDVVVCTLVRMRRCHFREMRRTAHCEWLYVFSLSVLLHFTSSESTAEIDISQSTEISTFRAGIRHGTNYGHRDSFIGDRAS